MLHKVEENTDWWSKYQETPRDLEARELEWEKIEALLRKTIGRLSIAGRGLDDRLDKHLRLIQELSREKRDEKLAAALSQLSGIVAALDEPKFVAKPRRSATRFSISTISNASTIPMATTPATRRSRSSRK